MYCRSLAGKISLAPFLARCRSLSLTGLLASPTASTTINLIVNNYLLRNPTQARSYPVTSRDGIC